MHNPNGVQGYYSGDAKPASSRELATTFRENYLIDPSVDTETQRRQANNIEGLKSINKFPARFGEVGINNFIENLEKNMHKPSPFDAEFITRFEMQNCPPDILITNYSMLEYMLDISYDSKKLVGNRSAEEKSILRAAVTTLHEALKKAVSLVLDIDYNEISGGWRPRVKGDGNSHIEMFFYDNLTSGAGYSSLIGSILDKVLERARIILTSCECSHSCKNCLDNYWNQRNHQLFLRGADKDNPA
jgi:ATP-dependent helicase YprA (DUF1998 family)